MMGTTVCFTAIAVFRPQNHSGHFSKLSSNVGFLSSKSPNSLFSASASSDLGIRLKSSSSIPKASHMQVSEDAPIEELGPSFPREIGQHDLLIVGPGVLGRLVAEKWREENPGCQVYGQTRTTDHHDELFQMGINPALNWTEATHKFPSVIYCAPPSRTSDYSGNVRELDVEVKQICGKDMMSNKGIQFESSPDLSSYSRYNIKLAALSWNGEGSFLFTSSSAPYDCNDNGPCDEDTPAVPIGRSPRTDVLLKAENMVMEFNGCVLRLAGLYKADRGAHNYWLEKGIVDSRPDHILNLIHYEDAASLAVAILKKKFRGKIFLGCDNHPLSRQEMMDLINRSGKFSKKFDKFTGTNDPLGKRLNNSKTRQEIGWEPKYPSFAHFLETI